ncbi:PfaD family polyunsaturated fatty acid/polyketide biosynthesis protein [Thermodesulfobacteriota bacterium]
MTISGLCLSDTFVDQGFNWNIDRNAVSFEKEAIKAGLLDLEKPCFIVKENKALGISNERLSSSALTNTDELVRPVAYAPVFTAGHLGDPEFREEHGTTYSYYTGAMANAIASEEMVIAMGKAGFLGSFGAGGLVPPRVEEAINRIQKELPNGPYAFNLIHSPNEPAIERGVVELYLKYEVPCIETAAFISLNPNVVLYRVAGLGVGRDNNIEIKNKIIAKISRREVATKFLEPPPSNMVAELLSQNRITREQAQLASQVPMADDITAEADSGGHTDNRPLVSLLSSIISLRNEIQEKYRYAKTVRVGAAGGIGTPESALAAFAMGASFVVTGSVNQACREAGACEHTRNLLAQADMADVVMAPAADMFEMGVKLQVLRRGTFFPMRAQKLYDFYNTCNSIEEIPAAEREKLEKQIFLKSLDTIWEETKAFFEDRDPSQIERAQNNPKRKMALIFRWYLGLASRWSNSGDPSRKMDYQIWCGPSMGAFNSWVKGSYLEDINNRRVVDVAKHIMTGAAFLTRIMVLRIQGISIPPEYSRYVPGPL